MSLKDRQQSQFLFGLLGVQSVAEVTVRCSGVVDLDGLGMWNVRKS